ncbi:DUF4178 domain-containing protein [Sphingomonas sp. AOB5]|uniref:DUF4178 domain-containing protein n=1 Tax=Sphingomonas sp. AOB5 TaxID=3034017 RepID=UPI0023F9280D|nr:DUF4178 domain-containing protein [Sphingomonas sp. AOB5]MDF7777200.1 DUF4178 domain-containing protein [Sphingomonas sp. AOB5]
MTLTTPCPNCGAEVVFRSAALPSRVCDYCRSLLVRSDDGVAVVGQSSPLPFDVSPIQIGVRGQVDGHGFEVIGRIRWGWTDGSWNEWLLLFDGGATAWLGDAMGQFMLVQERDLASVRTRHIHTIVDGRHAIPGTEVQMDREAMTIVDARDVICLAAEGELPFTPRPGWRMYSVDLRGKQGNVASLQRDDDGATFYDGRYVTLAELNPRGLRRFEGWAKPDAA